MAALEVHTLLERLSETDGVMLQLTPNNRPVWDTHGTRTEAADMDVIEPARLRAALRQLIDQRDWQTLERDGSVLCRAEHPSLGAHRVLALEHADGLSAVIKRIPARVPTAGQLGLPPNAEQWASLESGLLVITGPHNSGKSATAAALVDHINRTARRHIAILQRPVEFAHEPGLCALSLRQPGIDVPSQSAAVWTASRADVDVLVIDEVEEPAAVLELLHAAATGKLVLAVVRARCTATALSRLVRALEPRHRSLGRYLLARSFQGLIAQVLCRSTGATRIPAFEVAPRTDGIVDAVSADTLHEVARSIAESRSAGARLLDDSLEELVEQARIPIEEAERLANVPLRFTSDRAPLSL